MRGSIAGDPEKEKEKKKKKKAPDWGGLGLFG